MTIPPIVPYELPTVGLPANLADWRVDARRAVLLIHDMQQYFIDFFPASTSPITDLIHNIAAVRAAATERGVPVVYTAQPGGMTRDERGLLHDFWGPGMTDDPEARRIVADLNPGPHDTVLTKWRYSAFVRSELDDLIRGSDRDQLVITGVYAHVGCLMTAQDAFARDIQPFLLADAVADFSSADHQLALNYAARRCAVVTTTSTVQDQLATTPIPIS